jgi:hypothetical protein
VLAPDLLLGGWLAVVPDRLAFRASQLIVLAHVVLGVVTLPWFFGWAVRHAGGLRSSAKLGRLEKLTGWAFLMLACFAVVTGAVTAWGGTISRAHAGHSVAGVLLTALLAAHLWNVGRRGWSMGLTTFAAGAAMVGAVASRLPARSYNAEVSEFSFENVSSDQYEPADSCGECHTEQYAEWKQSTHGSTMHNPLFVRDMTRQPSSLGFDMARYGALARGARHDEPTDAIINACERCHTPTSFYGDDAGDALRPVGVAAEGVTCSFCHTVRAVHVGLARGRPIPETFDRDDLSAILPRLPYYVSAPQAVRHYIGEGSSSRLGRWIRNTLIRWRPDVHRKDMAATVMNDAVVCQPCHSSGDFDVVPQLAQKTFVSWESSSYHTNNPNTSVTCQDCHMAMELTGAKSREQGRLVPWGPIREHRRSHLFLGGNRAIADKLELETLSRREHELNRRAVDLSVEAVTTTKSEVEVRAELTTKLVGHDLPTSAAQNRWFWVELAVLDTAGRTLSATKPPNRKDDVQSESPLIFRCTEPPRPDCNTVLHPGVPLVVTRHLRIADGSAAASVTATLRASFDDEPLTSASAPLGR